MTFQRLLAPVCVFAATIFNIIAAPVDQNFTVDDLQFGNGKTKVAFDSSGRMYVTEKQGRVLLFQPDGSGGFLAPTILLDLRSQVDPGLEAGLLGFEVDPDHANNRFIYLFYTTPEEEPWDGTGDQRLVRYTMNTTFDGIENGSETILLSGLPRIVNFHKAGDIAIHPLDPYAILIALGDDDQIGGGGTLPQDLDSYVGKILRVDSSTGLGLPDNPHFNGNANSVRSRVWASGMRNPFRFAFHPNRNDTLYISENGDSTDRVAMVKAGGNGLWNGDDNGGFLTVDTPLFKVLHTTSPSLVGVEIVPSGPFACNGQPTLYLGNWLDGTSRFTLSDSSNPQGDDWDTLTPIPAGGASYWDQQNTAMDLHYGGDGHLYFVQTNGNASTAIWFPLRRFRFAAGTPPVAGFSVSPMAASGEAPFQVTLTDGSTAGSSPITSWLWDFGDGNFSTAQNPTHTYTTTGTFTTTLTVTDSVGLTSTAQNQLTATINTPVTLELEIRDGRTVPSIPVTSSFVISLFQADGTTPLFFTGGGGVTGNEITTSSDGNYNGTLNLPLNDSALVMVLASPGSPEFQPLTNGVSVSMGVSNIITRTFYPSSTTFSGRVLTLRGNPAVIDIGVGRNGQPFTFAGARDYLTNSNLPETGIAHRIDTDDLGYFSIPIPAAASGSTFQLTYAEDTGRGIYATGSRTLTAQTNTAVDASYQIAEWRGGSADDLSGQTYTPGVTFTSIQNIFSANCTGCHRANTTNNGGLDLTTGNSLADLVNQPSLFAPGLKLVEPGAPMRSYLFEKINSAAPQQGARMRPSDAMSLADQALIRDWITQLSPSYQNFIWTTFGTAPGSPNTGVLEISAHGSLPNGLAYTQPTIELQAAPADGSPNQGQLQLNGNATGLTMVIQTSNTLSASSWATVASRLRGQSTWRAAPGFSVTESSPGILQFADTAPDQESRFYRFGVSDDSAQE